jgi:spermidine synthase
MLSLVFGVTVFAVSAVLATFMMGLAIGALIFGRFVEKKDKPIFVFSVIHIALFISCVFFILLFPVISNIYLFINNLFNPGFYLSRILLFFISFAFMIIPTTLMGATFPVAVKVISSEKSLGKDVGILYAVNTLGSVLGCFFTVFVLLGFLGMNLTVATAALIDCLIGLSILPFCQKISFSKAK